MLEFCSLGSGSSGNAAILKIAGHKILIDAGLSLRRLEQSLAQLQLDPGVVDLVFLTHAHDDHARSVMQFAAKYDKPVYLTPETHRSFLRKNKNSLDHLKINFLKEELYLEDVLIKIFRLPHVGVHPDGRDDAGGNIGFLFKYSHEGHERKFAYFTDLGTMPENIYPEIENSDFYFIESNHDVLWQKASRRPVQVIERNLSAFGHLSNEQTGEILSRLITKDTAQRRTKVVMLAHLSSECNSHVLAKTTLEKKFEKQQISGVEIKIAPEKKLSEYICL